MIVIASIFWLIINLFNQFGVQKSSLNNEWLEYKLKYDLNFSNEEDIERKKIFMKNFQFIVDSNANKKNFTLEMNKFGHLERHERPSLLNVRNFLKGYRNKHPIYVGQQIPSKYDWLQAGVVTPVQDQLQCGSCYAFSAVGAIESQFAIHTGILQDLSEQEIVDCSSRYGNYGCYGGFPERVYKYCIYQGISKYSDYPYIGRQSQCKRYNPKSSYKLTGYRRLTMGDEDNLLRAIYNIGPISIAMDANHDEFAFYKSGIIDIPGCSSTRLNHAVLAVGYNLEKIPYLLVKNSYGTNWGLAGYFQIALYKENMCGIATDATFPIPLI